MLLNINGKYIERIFLLILALGLSFDWIFIYIPMLIIVMILSMLKSSKILIVPTLFYLVNCSFLFMFLWNTDGLILDSPFLSIFKYILVLTVMYIIVMKLDYEEASFFIYILCLFMIVNGLIIITYSYFLHYSTGVNYGYGNLFNPIHNIETKSPKIALSILSPLIIIIIIINRDSYFLRTILIALAIPAYIYIQSRTSIIFSALLLLFLFFIFLKEKSIKYNIFLLTTSVISIIALFLIYICSDININNYINFSDSRLYSDGLKSTRFMLWQDGFYKLFYNPLGYFSVDQNIEHVNYFHNIIFDSARIYGWLSAVFIILILFYSIWVFFHIEYIKSKLKYFLTVSLLFLVMMQDVIIEGNYLILMLFFYYILISDVYNARKRF